MWANIVKQAPAPAAPDAAPFTSADGCKVVVVDANAIINGIRLEGIADKAVTIQDVLEEVRDKQSRLFLASLATRLEVADPSEESLKAGARAQGCGGPSCTRAWGQNAAGRRRRRRRRRRRPAAAVCCPLLSARASPRAASAVTRFARETGDIHALSTVDVRLLALAHTLEVASHGGAHIKQHPSQVGQRLLSRGVLRAERACRCSGTGAWGRAQLRLGPGETRGARPLPKTDQQPTLPPPPAPRRPARAAAGPAHPAPRLGQGPARLGPRREPRGLARGG
jgi:hypothetical protein